MLTKKIKTRFTFLLLIILISVSLLSFIYFKLKQNILYFKTPTDIFLSNSLDKNTLIRVGGMVKKDSIEQNNDEIKFVLTDFKKDLIVVYVGAVPNLFSEQSGAVVEGKLNDKRYLIANRILAKHDENYMPPEVTEALRQSGKLDQIMGAKNK